MIENRISNYFKERSAEGDDRGGQLLSMQSTFKPSDWVPVRSEDVTLLDEKFCQSFTASLYRVYVPNIVPSVFTSIMAVYEDKILWLDDPIQNSDFEEFLRRENLLRLLPDQLHDFLYILTLTKFNYLGVPTFVAKVEDIRRTPEASRIRLIELGEHEILADEDKRIDEVKAQIQEPIINISGDGTIKLSFCVWALFFGILWSLDCYCRTDGTFSYEGFRLAINVGYYSVPR